MKNGTPIRHTIRFRRWSRKAYAAFASLGRCITIGCVCKSIANSSLSKQKTTGHTNCERENYIIQAQIIQNEAPQWLYPLFWIIPASFLSMNLIRRIDDNQ